MDKGQAIWNRPNACYFEATNSGEKKSNFLYFPKTELNFYIKPLFHISENIIN